MTLLNLNQSDKLYSVIEEVVNTILSCSDGKEIVEIYAKEGSFRAGKLGNWVGLMVEVTPGFVNTSLYDTLSDIMEQYDRESGLTLDISVEPADAERGRGTKIWKIF